MPVHASGLGSIGCALISRIGEHDRLFSVQQTMALGDVMDIGRRANDGVHQAGIRIDPNVRLHPEVPLVALLGLVHPGSTPN